MFQVTYSVQARKALRKMQFKMARRILHAMTRLAENPDRQDMDVKKLAGREGFRLRIGDWRVIYTRDGTVLAVERIGPRGDVYK